MRPRSSGDQAVEVASATGRDLDAPSRRFPYLSRYAFISLASLAVALVLWQLVTAAGLLTPNQLPSPARMVETFLSFFERGYQGHSWWEQIGSSLFRVFAGFALGVLVGVPLGLLMGMSKVVDAIVRPFVAFMRPIPMIAFIPVVILYFGIGELSKVLLIFASVFFYTTMNCAAGVASVPKTLILAGRNMGLRGWSLFRQVIVPASLPSIMNGIRLAAAVAWLLVVAAELVAAQSGLGYMILDASTFFRIPYVFLGIWFIGIIGLSIDTLFAVLTRRVVHWEGQA